MSVLFKYIGNNADLKKILSVERTILGKWPTPLTKNSAYNNFFIKRDDLSGYGRGGIKTRKLETLIGHYIQKGKKHFIVVVPNISNLRSDLELLAVTYNLKILFIVSNTPFLPKEKRKATDNEFVKYFFSGKTMISTAYVFFKVFFNFLIKNKKLPVIVLPGASHPSAVVGSAIGLIELYHQFKEEGIKMPKHLFISAASGGSAAGLILASIILKECKLSNMQVTTVKVYPIQLKIWIYFLLYWTKLQYKLETKIPFSSINIHSDIMKYGERNVTLENICKDVKQQFDLDIDHIYGARTWKAIQDFAMTNNHKDGLVFWHCGFTLESKIF